MMLRSRVKRASSVSDTDEVDRSFSWKRVGQLLLLCIPGAALLILASWVASITGGMMLGVFLVYVSIAAVALGVQVWTALRRPVSRREWGVFVLFVAGFLALGLLHGWVASRS
jgi:hypothetical protein